MTVCYIFLGRKVRNLNVLIFVSNVQNHSVMYIKKTRKVYLVL